MSKKKQMTPEEIQDAYTATLKQLKAVTEQYTKLRKLSEKTAEEKQKMAYELECQANLMAELKDKAAVAEKTAHVDAKNPLVAMFTHKDPMMLNDKPRYNFELIMYDYYSKIVPLWSVAALDIVQVQELEETPNFPAYNNYVLGAKEALKEGEELWGIKLHFDADTKD